MQKVHYAFDFLKYKLTASHKKGHGIHSPFVFRLIHEVFSDALQHNEYREIEKLRREMKKRNETFFMNDFGAKGYEKSRKRRLKSFVSMASVPPKYGKLLAQLVRHFNMENILEFGTGTGLSTLYLAKGSSQKRIMTMEGDKYIASLAVKNFEWMKEDRIDVTIGSFDKVLDQCLDKMEKLDFVFFDGNHKKEPTIAYFETCLKKIHPGTLFVFDDIHWSSEMKSAWTYIKKHEKVKVTVDIFRMGLVFFQEGLQKQDFIVKF